MKTREEIFNTPLNQLDKNYQPLEEKETVIVWERFSYFLIAVLISVFVVFTFIQ